MSKREKDPAFLFYPNNWLEGTAEMMPEEKGVYIDLLCHQHQKGSLPTEINRLARIVGLSEERFLQLWSAIKPKFHQMDDRLVNLTLARITTKREDRAKKNRINGTFALLIRQCNLNYKIISKLKKQFNFEDYINLNDKDTTDAVTNWFNQMVSKKEGLWSESIEDINETINTNTNNTTGEEINFEISKNGHSLSMEDRINEFANKISQFRNKYDDKMLMEFLEYWTEHNENSEKLRFETKEIFNLSKRLAYWKRNHDNFKKNGKQTHTADEYTAAAKKMWG